MSIVRINCVPLACRLLSKHVRIHDTQMAGSAHRERHAIGKGRANHAARGRPRPVAYFTFAADGAEDEFNFPSGPPWLERSGP